MAHNNYFDKLTTTTSSLMENRVQGFLHETIGEVVHVEDFDFIHTRYGETAVLTFVENPKAFYFAGRAITNLLKNVDADGMREALKKETVTVEVQTSKAGNEYLMFEFTD